MARLLAGFFGLFLLLPFGATKAGPQRQVTVFAAASLADALAAVDAAYTRATGISVREDFASSSTLARQIAAGAPAQVFISADRQWMDYLDRKGLVAAPTPLLGNSLVLVAPVGSPTRPRPIGRNMDWSKLLGPGGRLAVGDPDHVPAGIYAREALQRIGAWTTLEPRLARAEDVRGALALVERGDAPLGVVYATDARPGNGVKIVGVFPPATHRPIVYPAAILKGSGSRAAKSYFQFLSGADAQRIFARFGFPRP